MSRMGRPKVLDFESTRGRACGPVRGCMRVSAHVCENSGEFPKGRKKERSIVLAKESYQIFVTDLGSRGFDGLFKASLEVTGLPRIIASRQLPAVSVLRVVAAWTVPARQSGTNLTRARKSGRVWPFPSKASPVQPVAPVPVWLALRRRPGRAGWLRPPPRRPGDSPR